MAIWHEDETTAPRGGHCAGGHAFACAKHAVAYHVILVIDRSGSMTRTSCRPSALDAAHKNLFGCVLEASRELVDERKRKGLPEDKSVHA